MPVISLDIELFKSSTIPMFRCAICQETLDIHNIAAVKCGHTFHLACLTQWLQRSKSCPSCRHPVKNPSHDLIEHLYLEYCSLNSFLSTPNTSLSSEDLESRYIALQSSIASLNDEISSLKSQSQDKSDKIKDLTQNIAKLEKSNKTLQNNFDAQACKISLLKDRLANCDHLEDENKKLLLRNKNLEKKVSVMESLSKILDGSNDEARKVVDNLSYADFKETKILLNALKEQLESSNIKLSKSSEENRKLRNQVKESSTEKKKLSNLVQELKEEIKLLRTRPNQTPFNRNLKEVLKDTPVVNIGSPSFSGGGVEASFTCSTPNILVNDRKVEKNLGNGNRVVKIVGDDASKLPPFRIPFEDLDSTLPSLDVPILGGLRTRQKSSKINDENLNKMAKKPPAVVITKQPDGLGGRGHFRGQNSKRPNALAASRIVKKSKKSIEDNSCIILSD